MNEMEKMFSFLEEPFNKDMYQYIINNNME